MPPSKPRSVGTLPPYLAKQRAIEIREDGKLLKFYSASGAADVIGCSVSLAAKMATDGDVRVLVSADGRLRMLFAEDVEAIARERRAAGKTK